MTEYKLFTGDVPYVSTAAFYADRERAPHLEQGAHQPRLLRTASMIHSLEPKTVVDLGCGDGGLLSLLKIGGIEAWGYDFQPSNEAGWQERGVHAELRDVFSDMSSIRWGEVAVLTEVLEHVADPHGVVATVAKNVRFVVASSPHGDTPEHHGAEHAWAWDIDGYYELFKPHFEAIHHEVVTWSQVYVGQSRCTI